MSQDVIVRVNYDGLVGYPSHMRDELHPEFNALRGIATYSLGSVRPWLHPTQERDGSVSAHDLHRDIVQWSILPTCLSLWDLMAIQRLGIDVFRRYFAGKYVFAWKAAILARNGDFQVPYLFESNGTVFLLWLSFLDRIGMNGIAARFPE